MVILRRFVPLAAVAAASLALAGMALAGSVKPARGATRTSLVRAFVAQDGSSVGLTGEYVTRSRPQLGVVCQKTPDAGLVRFLFKRSGGSWRYLFSTNGTRRGTSLERRLERACH